MPVGCKSIVITQLIHIKNESFNVTPEILAGIVVFTFELKKKLPVEAAALLRIRFL